MNCKKGDLAVVVRHFETCCAIHRALGDALIGTTVTCAEQYTTDAGTPGWTFERPVDVSVYGQVVTIEGCGDPLLQPLRGQSDKQKMLEALSQRTGLPVDNAV